MYGTQAFELLVRKYGLIDPTTFYVKEITVNVSNENYRKAVCGKTARTD